MYVIELRCAMGVFEITPSTYIELDFNNRIYMERR